MKLWTFKCGTIDEDELRDNARDGGSPDSIHLTLYRTKEEAIAVMLEEANDVIEGMNEDADDEDKMDTYTAADIKNDELNMHEVELYTLLEFELPE